MYVEGLRNPPGVTRARSRPRISRLKFIALNISQAIHETRMIREVLRNTLENGLGLIPTCYTVLFFFFITGQ